MHPAAQIFYDAFETGDVASLDLAFAPDWKDNTPPLGRPADRQGMKDAILALRRAIPDLSCAVEETVECGDRLVARTTFSGTHAGALGPVPASGKPVRFIAIDVHEVREGRIAQSWHLEDTLSLFMQIGAVRL